MARFIPRDMPGRKACWALNVQSRETWSFPSAQKKMECNKRYDCRKSAHAGNSFPARALLLFKWSAAYLALSCLRRLTVSAVRPQRLTTISVAHHPGWLPSPVRGGSG